MAHDEPGIRDQQHQPKREYPHAGLLRESGTVGDVTVTLTRHELTHPKERDCLAAADRKLCANFATTTCGQIRYNSNRHQEKLGLVSEQRKRGEVPAAERDGGAAVRDQRPQVTMRHEIHRLLVQGEVGGERELVHLDLRPDAESDELQRDQDQPGHA